MRKATQGSFVGSRWGRTLVVVAAAQGAVALPQAWGGNGVWTDLAGGVWSTAGNWSGGTIADGAGSTADFSTLNITSDTTVTLDTSRSIGTLKFQDTTASNNWFLTNSSSAVLTLNNGTSQPVVDVLNQNLNLNLPLAGTNGFVKIDGGGLLLSANNSALSGTVRIQNSDVTPTVANAFGTGTVVMDGSALAVSTRILMTSGVTVSNPIVINYSRVAAGNNGVLYSNGAFNATFAGPVTFNAVATSGGQIAGSTGTNFLYFTGPITDTLAANYVSGGTGNGIVVRSGNINLAGGGSYFRMDERNGTLQLGANNGVATNAILNLGGNGNGVFDLDGFNQTLVGVTNLIGSNSNSITNSSSTAPSTLTFAPNPSNYSVANFATISFSGAITDASASTPLSIAVNGDPTGILNLQGTGNSYRGSTTITSGTLTAASLAAGGSNSSIGASTNAASNLVFGGGTLQYTGGTTSTDRGFTINAGSTGTIGVSSASAVLTISGGSAATNGALVAAGPGTLVLSGANLHTGATTVTGGGTLELDGSLSSGSAVGIASGATLSGIGTAGGKVTPAAGAIVSPGDAGVGTLTVGSLALNTGAIVDFQFGASSNSEITVSSSAGLALSGGNLNLYQVGTTTAFSTNGTYTLFNLTGGLTGSTSNLTISNPVAGKVYALSGTSTALSLTIATATTREWADTSGDDQWTTAGNWIGGSIPNAVGQTAKFGSNLAGSDGTVNLNGSKTVSGLIFDNSSTGYDLTGSGSTLTLNNGVAAAAITVANGNHSIEVPIALSGATSISTSNPTDSLSLNGNILGAKSVAISGPGTVTFAGSNGFTTVNVTGAGTVNVGNGGTSGTLGSGNVTLASGVAVNFNRTTPYSMPGSITGAGTISQLGSGGIAVGGSVTGVTSVSATGGALSVGGSLNQSGGVTVTGNGSLSVGAGLTGAGNLLVNTSGAVTLTGASTYGGGTELDAGTLSLGASSTLPSESVLAVNGGTLDLHGNSISLSNILDTSGSSGVITNNGPSGSTSTITFAGFQANYNSYASLQDGANGGKVALVVSIASTFIGGNYIYGAYGSSSYSGGTTVNSQSVEAFGNSAFGTGPVTMVLNISSVNLTRFIVAGGVTLNNGVIVQQANAGTGQGAIQYDTATQGTSTILGPVSFLADALSGGDVTGALIPGQYLNLNGPVTLGGTATTFTVRGGNVGLGGGGNYGQMQVTGVVQLTAANGISPTAVVDLGVSSINGNATLDLNSFSQTLSGLTQQALATATSNVTNSSGGACTLTINTTGTNTYAGGIDGNLGITLSGRGSQGLTGALTYSGNTTVTGGVLTVGAPLQSVTGGLAVSGSGSSATLAAPGVAGSNVLAAQVGFISVSAGGSVVVPASARATVSQTVIITGGLDLAASGGGFGGSLDLGNNDMIVNNGVESSLDAMVRAGALRASSAGGSGMDAFAGLAVVPNSDGQGGALYATFDGVNVVSTDVLVKYTYIGDTDLNGVVDANDLANTLAGLYGGLSGWGNGDFTYSGRVTTADVNLLLASLAGETGSFGNSVGGGGAVPEPGSLALAVGALPVLGRRRR